MTIDYQISNAFTTEDMAKKQFAFQVALMLLHHEKKI
jgi:hypothetical protein